MRMKRKKREGKCATCDTSIAKCVPEPSEDVLNLLVASPFRCFPFNSGLWTMLGADHALCSMSY